MASEFSRTIEGGHDMIYDYYCTTCARQKLNAEALFYCKDCRKLLCEECDKYHVKFFEGHRILGRKEVAQWGDVIPVTSSLMCDEHLGKELEMYCEDHGCVCCHICISVKHRSCKEVKPVSEVSKGIRKKSEFQSFLSQAAKSQSRLKTVYDKQENNIDMLQNARVEITATFGNMRQKFNQIVDRLEEESTTELDRLLTMLKEQVTIDRNACNDFIDKIQKLLDDIQTIDEQCDEQAFRCYKKCCEHMASADKLLFSMQNVDFQIKFIPDSKMEQYLFSLENLGNFFVIPGDHSDTFKYKQFAPLLAPPNHINSVENSQTYNVTTDEDKYLCFVTGICQLPDGQSAIVDRSNSKVKLLSASTYCVLDALKMPPGPRDICHITRVELAVTVCQEISNSIQFIIAVDGKLSQTKTVSLDDMCFGIAYHNAQLYVGFPFAMYTYSLSGIRTKKILEFREIADKGRCCHNDEGSRIYVTSPVDHLLYTLDSSGNTLSTFSDPELQYPTGVCVAHNGSVFVCGFHSGNVIQVDKEGKKKMTTLATDDNGISHPISLCYDRKTHTLLVGQWNTSNLLVLKLK